MPGLFPPEYCRRAIDRIEFCMSVAEVIDGLEATAVTVCNWWNQHLGDSES
jgi:hypothetical protein